MPAIGEAKILIMATDGFEQAELIGPKDRLEDRGAKVTVAAPKERQSASAIYGWDKTDWGDTVSVDTDVEDVDPAEYDALVLPGGVMNPDKLRTNAEALDVIRAFLKAGKVVAAICHAPWLLVEVGAVKGRPVTSYKSIRTDVINAGGLWRDEAVVVDRGLITSRNPGDIEPFTAKIVEEIEEGHHSARRMAAE